MDPEDPDYLDKWRMPNQSTPLPASQRLVKSVRSGTPRVEPGTRKVNEHEAKKKAVTLLYAVAERLKQPANEHQPEFLSRIKKDMEEVVADFGFSQGTIQAAGEKLGNNIMEEINQDQDMKDLDAQCQALMARVDAMKKARQAQRGGGHDSDGATDGPSTNDIARNTRGGTSKKRNRDVSVIEEQIQAVQAVCKRMKCKD